MNSPRIAAPRSRRRSPRRPDAGHGPAPDHRADHRGADAAQAQAVQHLRRPPGLYLRRGGAGERRDRPWRRLDPWRSPLGGGKHRGDEGQYRRLSRPGPAGSSRLQSRTGRHADGPGLQAQLRRQVGHRHGPAGCHRQDPGAARSCPAGRRPRHLLLGDLGTGLGRCRPGSRRGQGHDREGLVQPLQDQAGLCRPHDGPEPPSGLAKGPASWNRHHCRREPGLVRGRFHPLPAAPGGSGRQPGGTAPSRRPDCRHGPRRRPLSPSRS